MEDLHTVLYSQGDRIFWYHVSFPDFIFNPARSNFHLGGDNFTFSCNEPAHHNLLGQSCFRVMESGLRFNMGDIRSSFLFDNENTDALSEKVNNNITAVLRYSCHHWTHHLPSPELIDTNRLRRCISDFLQIRVLFWIEAMNLLRLRNQCTPMLQHARRWVLKVRIIWFELYCKVMLLCSARAMIWHWHWHVTLVKLPILLRISLGAQLLNRRRTCISQHWQHGRRTLVSVGIGKSNSLASLSLLIQKAISICH